MKTNITAILVTCLLAALSQAASITDPLPYLSLDDTPEGFFDDDSSIRTVQDFEGDGPYEDGFSINKGFRIGPNYTSGSSVPVTDSVDGDDGSIDGSGLEGSSWFSGNGAGNLTITFDEPTAVASFTFTDTDRLASDITVRAYDEQNTLLAERVFAAFVDEVYTGTTDPEDRFIGVTAAEGETIKSLFVSVDTGSGIEIDHVQFLSPVPEPASGMLLMSALLGAGRIRRRRAS